METGFSLALSFLIAGMLFMSIMNFNASMSQTAVMNNMDLSAQVKLKGMVDIVKSDFRKMGYKTDKEQNYDDNIIAFTQDSIAFKTVYDTISTIDTAKIELFHNKTDSSLVRRVTYPPSAVDVTPGVQSGETTSIDGLDSLHIRYFDSDGREITPGYGSAADIRFMEVTMIATLGYSYKPDENQEEYRPRAFWKSNICPKNLGQ